MLNPCLNCFWAGSDRSPDGGRRGSFGQNQGERHISFIGCCFWGKLQQLRSIEQGHCCTAPLVGRLPLWENSSSFDRIECHCFVGSSNLVSEAFHWSPVLTMPAAAAAVAVVVAVVYLPSLLKPFCLCRLLPLLPLPLLPRLLLLLLVLSSRETL